MVDSPGIRNVARDLAPRLGMRTEEFLKVSRLPAYEGMLPARHAAAATVYVLARYLTGEAHAGSDASEMRWATREELNALDMPPRVRTTVHATWPS
jgi:hypothetical protein